MVRFQPVSDDDDSDASFDSQEQPEQIQRSRNQQLKQQQQQRRQQQQALPSDSEGEEEDIQLPLRGRTPQVPSKTQTRFGGDEEDEFEERKQQPIVDEAEDDAEQDQDEEEEPMEDDQLDQMDEGEHEQKYTSRYVTRQKAPTTDARKLQLMDSVLMDEEEESFLRTAAGGEAEQPRYAAAEAPSRFVPQPKRPRASGVPKNPLRTFLASVPPFVRPSTVDHHPRNPLLTPAAQPKTRSVLDFMQHSFRVGWAPSGSSFFFASGIDGAEVNQQQLDLLSVDLGTQQPVGGSVIGKKELVQVALETHLEFHSHQAAPSSAKVFGGVNGAAPQATGMFTFGASNQQALTPYTKLIDAYLASLRTLRNSPFGSHADKNEVDLAISTLVLLRVLFSSEEAERRAPKLSKSQEALERSRRPAAAGEDLSVVTAREDSYATLVGRESAFEQGWLQPTVAEGYVVQRMQQLQRSNEKGSDGLTGSKMPQVIVHLIGHDLQSAVDVCISAGNFRLATLLSQLDSFAVTGRLQADSQPVFESSQHDISRQLSLWISKEKGLGSYIPKDVETIYKLMSGDVLVEPTLDWIASLGLHYWYVQPKGENTNIHRALMNYKKNAFMDQRGQVRKPFPPYRSYVPLDRRSGSDAASGSRQSRGVLEDDADDDDMSTDGNTSQALIVISAAAPARSAVEYYDVRYGLLDLYTAQSRSLARVLSPQSHVPHVLDHNLSWHVFAILQSTPVNQFGPHLAQLHMSYIHQLELLSNAAGVDGDDFWKWSVYVALAAVFPRREEFDREQVIKTLLSTHVTWNPHHPFALPNIPSAFGKPALPTSIPILRVDSSNVFSTTLVQAPTPSAGLSWGAASTTPAEDFLLHRCHIPAAWFCESKAVSAVYDREWSVAVFYYLHAGETGLAYKIFREQLMAMWILAVINEIESGVDVTTQQSGLESSLFVLLQLFHSVSHTLFGWSNAGGGLVLSFLEFHRNFERNLQSFTYREISTSASSLKDRAERITNFRTYKQELQEFLKSIEALSNAPISNAVEDSTLRSLESLAWSKMSGTVMQHLHALQPLEAEMKSEGREEQMASTMQGTSVGSAAAAGVDISAGEFVSAADRLAVLSDWKDSWLQQFS